MKQEKQDLRLIQSMAQELGLSPWDVFMHWVEIGEIQKVTAKIAYKNGDSIEVDLMELCHSAKIGLLGKTDITRQRPPKTEVVEPKNPFEKDGYLEDVDPTLKETNPTTEVTPSPTPEAEPLSTLPPAQEEDKDNTSNSDNPATITRHGLSCINAEQNSRIKIGAYVYSTGYVSSKYKCQGPTQIKGIILSRSDNKITIIKYIGCGLTGMDAAAQTKDHWRFLTYQECQKIARHKDTLSSSLSEMRLKQIKNDSMLLYKEDCQELYVYNVGTRSRMNPVNDKSISVSRTYAVYLAKDLDII